MRMAEGANLPPVSLLLMGRETAPIPNSLAAKLLGDCNFKKIGLNDSAMSLEILETTEEVIEALGGNRPVAQITSSKPGAVSNWRGFKSFPPKTYVAMTDALHAIGKDAPASLWGMKMPAEQESAS